jgi:hypothetical protein
LVAVAAYIELNPVRAGLCADPKDYRYCGYAEALAKGCALAREGIRPVLAQPASLSWKELSRQYRQYLFIKGSVQSPNKEPAFAPARAQQVVVQQKGELSNAYAAGSATSAMGSSWEARALLRPISVDSSKSWLTSADAPPRA